MKKILFLYHFYYPDQVVSARYFQELGESLASQGWTVEVWPSNQFHDARKSDLPSKEDINGVRVHRVMRPGWKQSSGVGRILNSLWMVLGWVLRWYSTAKKADIVLIGTDPLFALFTAICIKVFGCRAKVVHWCFDLYPDAAIADGRFSGLGFCSAVFKKLMAKALGVCDLIVDIGGCMHKRIAHYAPQSSQISITPWAFDESGAHVLPSQDRREEFFGAETKLAILYSGNFGQAHTAELALRLAENLYRYGIRLGFSIKGHAAEKFKSECIKRNAPVFFMEVASAEKAFERIALPDIHFVSLKKEWTGTVVPSKFFGAIAAGRPVLFEGSEESAIAAWIREHRIGWVLTQSSFNQTVDELMHLSNHADELQQLQRHCADVYRRCFSRKLMLSKWHSALGIF